MKFCCYYHFSQYPLKPNDLLGKVKIYLIFPQKRNQGEAIKSVIVETANNVTSSLLDFSPIMMMLTMTMMMMILVANGPDPR